ncbi:MAG: NTP transferase domain-containing protein [Telmatospirillum sp.]|nr:NTP transferase domain-containing protein [Telmatospirillum sp.]
MANSHVIIQAGGKGTRLEHYCWNKPKCLVPVSGKPMLYNLFEKFPDSSFNVIVDYKADVLERYVDVFPPHVPLRLVSPNGKGTASGIAQSLSGIPDGEPFWLVWSDLVFGGPLKAPMAEKPVVFLSRNFPCRWSARKGRDGKWHLTEVRSDQRGVMGLFWFPNKSFLAALPEEGEFVRWVGAHCKDIDVDFCDDAVELGTLNALMNHWDSGATTRFFNKITYRGAEVLKEAVLPDYAPMIDREIAWYEQVSALGYDHIPALIGRNPMTLARIDGLHPYQLQWGAKGRRHSLDSILDALGKLHALKTAPSDKAAMRSVYFDKTWGRLDKVRRLFPEIETWPSLQVNGVTVPNLLFKGGQALLEQVVGELQADDFTVIHGDPTFCNTMIDGEGKPWFIDPRGAFASPGILGDPNYDWAKVYYSVAGNYDNFNRRQFILTQEGPSVDVEIRESGWSHLKEVFRERFGQRLRTIRILHALIWLALSGWVDDDYDSILAAYYNGLYHLQGALES